MLVTRGGTGCTPPKTLNPATGSCERTTDNPGNPPNACPSTPNPVSYASGNKHFDFVDFDGQGTSPLQFGRHYNSSPVYYYQALFGTAGITRSPVGLHWYHNYHQGLTITTDAAGGNIVKLTRNTGQTFTFTPGSAANTWQGEADINYRLEDVAPGGIRTGWKVTTPDDTVETYNPIGDLLTITDRTGLSQTLSYSCTTVSATCPVATPTTTAPYAGLLIKVTDNFGRSLDFTYNPAGQMATMADPVGNAFSYGYDTSGNLKTVTYPDETPLVPTDNPILTYLYGGEASETGNICSLSNTPACTPDLGVSYTHALTGITDENGIRYATYKYDGTGRAVSTEHAVGGIEKYGLEYLDDDPNTAVVGDALTRVTDPLDSVRTTHFTTVLGIVKPTGTDQPLGAGCGPASSHTEYDANGNVASRTDFNGHKTCYAYDLARNLETARVEGIGLPSVTDCATVLGAGATLPANTRKTSTAWHPSYRLPVTVAEPKRLTTTSYDANGNVLTRSEQATTDANGGAGLSPVVGGPVRKWTYTYNSLGPERVKTY